MFNKKVVNFIISLLIINTVISQDSLPELCKSHYIRNIEFCFYDFLAASPKSIIIPLSSHSQLEHYITNGIHFDGSSILGCSRITNSDMLLMPDLSTPARKIPWMYDHMSMMRIMCTIHQDKDTPYFADPRAILQKELNKLHDLGFDFHVGPEIEFYILDAQDDKYTPVDMLSYTDATRSISTSNALVTIMQVLNEMDLNIEKIHHEVGNGQFEVSLKRDNALVIADAILTTKDTLQILGKNYHKKISFMPKPFAHKPGNGMHINMSLYDINNNLNAFYDEQNPHKLSIIGQQFLAGIIKHVPELTLVLNSSINSYKRLGGHEAPKFICVGAKNRSALIRLPQAEQPEAVRAEIRSPDGLANPYMALAALLCAGMEGIKNGYSLPSLIEENLYAISEDELTRKNIIHLPQTFEQAIYAFEHSSLMQELFGPILFNNFLSYKKQELEAYQNSVTDWEWERYL